MRPILSPEDELSARGVVGEEHQPRKSIPVAERKTALDTTNAASLAGLPVPSRSFLDEARLFPSKNVTSLSGDGGTGKTLVLMQLAASVASGTSWIGIGVTQGRVLYYSAEDDLAELHIRLHEICVAENLELAGLGNLELAVLAGQDAVLGTEEKGGSRIGFTPLFDRLGLKLQEQRPTLLIIDNLADVFAGNENVRPLARQFIGGLRGLAIRYDCVIILVSHPSLTGLNSGSGTSGNTAWNNSVRSRLYLTREKDEQGTETDVNVRVLQTMKSNYGPTGGEFRLRWQEARFVRTDAPSASVSEPSTKAHKAEHVFLRLLRWHNDKNVNISPHRSSTYAPIIFAKHKDSEGVKKHDFEKAMTSLLDKGEIEIVKTGYASRPRWMLAVVEIAGNEYAKVRQ